jgi:ectoine hydroxylase
MTQRTDVYPSRQSGKPGIQERLDPVVHASDRSAGPLEAGLVEGYDRDGFLLLDPLFSEDELDVMREELARLQAGAEAARGEDLIREPGSEVVRSIFRVHRTSPVFARLASDARLVRVAEQILGEPVYVHQSRLNYKPGFVGKEFYWHSDFETWHVEDGMPRMRALSASITLLDNTETNGPLMLVPGSQRRYVACVGETPEDHFRQSLRKQEYGVPDHDSLRQLVDAGGIVTATGPAGTTVFFDCNVMHGSNGNITPTPRSNVFIVYNAVSNRVEAPFGPPRPRPEFLAERSDFTPVSAIEGRIRQPRTAA